MTQNELIARIKSHQGMLENLGFVALSLFGSYARGDQQPGSDVDLLYGTNDRLSLQSFLEAQTLLQDQLGLDVDLVAADGLSPILAKYIDRILPIYGALALRVRPSRQIGQAPLNPTQIRARLGVSQQGLADLLGIPKKTIQNWEQGIRKPRGPAQQLLRIVAQYPELVRKALAS